MCAYVYKIIKPCMYGDENARILILTGDITDSNDIWATPIYENLQNSIIKALPELALNFKNWQN